MRKSKAEREFERLMKSKKRTCHSCSYYRSGYCNDLDVHVDPDDPACSDANYYA